MSVPELGLVEFSNPEQLPDDAPLVVLGPGIGTSVANLYGGVVSRLAHEMRVVGWDLPGHGVSGPTRDFTVAELAQGVLAAVAGQLSSGPFHYVGTSIGGAVGQQLLADPSDRLASLTLIATTDYFPDPQGWNERADLVARAGTPTQVINSAKLWFAPHFLAHHPEVGTALLHDLQNADRYSYAAACRSLAGFDLRETQPGTEVPVLALSGPGDVVAGPETVQALAKKLGARHETIANTSHLLAAEAPEVTAGHITRFISAHR
ncbi:alpha/beta fold hydrolase [Kocuria sp. cx-455]|uniref:alpha/beta fold hydrolase n=1 Tax=unclassified Candidatus Sulfotelmatobacter TaxID=2635724 RepID=UPI00168575F6|nr:MULTISPECIES: alpha/beta fold hydrolase [unclassified Candidatus Sulfotelmatobacter]MBD2762349.1 alpha/beta fold hydrolase [Kocuria sp. cx-116]MBD2764321.1 alpha/beta fold hydrolase [Kocuria sp. cx-455]